jgi:hypothetical protein
VEVARDNEIKEERRRREEESEETGGEVGKSGERE